MINAKRNPIGWPVFLMEIEETKEHLEILIDQMHNDGSIDEEDFKVQIFHAMSHPNRLWNGRNHTGEIGEKLHNELSKTPIEFSPIG